MLHFVVARTRTPGDRLTQKVVSLLGQLDCPTALVSSSHVRWTASDTGLHFAAWTDDESSSRWSVERTSLSAQAGQPLALEPPIGRRGVLEHLAHHRPGQPIVSVLDRIEGVYSLVRLESDGSGQIANDSLGLHLLYWGQTESTTYVANRASLVAAALEAESGVPPARDRSAMVHVALLGNMLGTETGYRGVQTIPFGAFVELGADGSIDFPKGWPSPWDTPAPANGLSESMVDAVEDRMVRIIRAALADSTSPPLAQLTAGKDSRLVLAMVERAGVLSDTRFFTYGDAATPDARGAAAIAERLGLEFELRRWPSPPDGFITQYREHVAHFSGELGCWESVAGHENPDGVILSGLVGETLRSGFPRMVNKIDSVDRLRTRFGRLLESRIDLLQKDVAEAAIEETLDLIVAPHAAGYPIKDLLDIYFLEHRQRRWVGPQLDRLAGLYLPLYSAIGLRTGFSLGPDARRDETLRLALMARAGLNLDDVEFGKPVRYEVAQRVGRTARTGGELPEGRVGETDTRPTGSVERPRPVPASGRTTPASASQAAAGAAPVEPRGSSRQVRRARRVPNRTEAVRHFVESDIENPAFSILDRSSLLEALDDYGGLIQRKQIEMHWALTPLIWLGGIEQ